MKIIEREIPKRGDYYRYFKGKVYVIIDGEAENCTNNADHSERFVVYRADENSSKIYIREQSEFLASWANQPQFFRKMPFLDFVTARCKNFDMSITRKLQNLMERE